MTFRPQRVRWAAAFLSMESGESVDLVHIASMPKNSEMRFELPPLYRESELFPPRVSFYQTSFEEQWPGSLHRLVEYSNDRSAVCPQLCIAGNSDLNRTCSPVKQVVSREEWSIQEINPLFVSVCWQQRYVCPFCETQILQHLKTCFCQWNEMNYTIYINILYHHIISEIHSPQTDRPVVFFAIFNGICHCQDTASTIAGSEALCSHQNVGIDVEPLLRSFNYSS